MTHPSFDEYGMLIDHTDHLPLVGRLANTFDGLHLSGYRLQQLRAA